MMSRPCVTALLNVSWMGSATHPHGHCAGGFYSAVTAMSTAGLQRGILCHAIHAFSFFDIEADLRVGFFSAKTKG